MKLYLRGFYLFLFLSLTLVACKKQEMEMDFYIYENEYKLTSDDSIVGSLNFAAEVELPVKYHKPEALKSLQQQIVAKVFGEVFNSIPLDSVLIKYASTLFDEYKRSNEPFIRQLADMQGSKAFLNNEISIQALAMYLDDHILSYSYERYAFMGGAHGNSSRLLYNFDTNTGLLFEEKDLFGEDYEELLSRLIKEQIVEDNAQMESVADLTDFQFFEDQIKPNNNFFITPEGLAYVYNPYDIAPYSTGQIIVVIEYEKLRPILKAGNPVEYIYSDNY